jgi:ParB family chromosome partitioning protein
LDLPEEISELLKSDKLTAGHCRALLGLRDKSMMAPLANKIIHRNLSVSEAESTVKTLNAASARGENPAPKDVGINVNYLADLERKATDMLGRRCRISGGKSRRVIQIEYTDNADLESILVGLCGKEIIEE